MKNLLLIAALFFGLSFAANAQDYSKNKTDGKDVTQEVKHGAKKTGNAIEEGAKDVKDEAKDVKSDMREDEPQVKSQAERQVDKQDRSKAGNAVHKTGKAVGDGAKWTYDKAKHNKVTKNVFNQPGDE